MVVRAGDRTVTLFGVLLDAGKAALDNGTLHARSAAEAGISFSEDEARKGKGRRVAVAWMACEGDPDGEGGLMGATASEMWIDTDRGTGYKKLTAHTHAMTRAMRGILDLSLLTADERRLLRGLLVDQLTGLWNAAAPAVHASLK